MTLYLILGGAVFVAVSLTAWLVFAYKAGRNSARVVSERQNASDAAQTAKAAQQMLDARTNGIRSDSELLSTLEKGKF